MFLYTRNISFFLQINLVTRGHPHGPCGSPVAIRTGRADPWRQGRRVGGVNLLPPVNTGYRGGAVKVFKPTLVLQVALFQRKNPGENRYRYLPARRRQFTAKRRYDVADQSECLQGEGPCD